MIQAITVEYDTAKLLSESGRDVIVHKACSGCVCRFCDYHEWPFNGSIRSWQDIVDEVGTGNMDGRYSFFWINTTRTD